MACSWYLNLFMLSFFFRVGEAERQLKLLFEQAHAMQPSIIFFDEIDGLAPVRSSRQDQIHSSIVSTLLALMDGLDSRGQVIVIGATNRVDAIDPALRRPGRFDRELMFSLPNKFARRTILDIHTRHWQPRPEANFLHSIADRCVGYCGADLRALCTEATLRAIRRKYPQIYASVDKLAIDPSQIRLKQCDFIDAMRHIVPASHRSANVHARTLPNHLVPILQAPLDQIIKRVREIFPLGALNKSAQANGSHEIDVDSDDDHPNDPDATMTDVSSSLPLGSPVDATVDMPPSSFPLPSNLAVSTSTLVTAPLSSPNSLLTLPPRPSLPMPFKPRFLLYSHHPNMGQAYLGPSLLHHFEEYPTYSLDLPLLLGDGQSKNAEESCVRIIHECKQNSPSILYWPHIDLWWNTANESLQNTILMLINDLPTNSAILLFATADCVYAELPLELQSLFPLSSASSTSSSASFTRSYEIVSPTSTQLLNFFRPILGELRRPIPRMRQVNQIATAPPTVPKVATVELPKIVSIEVKTPEQEIAEEASLTPAQLSLKLDHEESLLRLQRMSFRDILQRLLKSFAEFEYPVDVEQFPDYLDVVPQPICLQDVLTHVNEDRAFDTVTKLLNEIDLIVSNCKEYSAHCQHQYRALVNKACHMQDMALSMVAQIETRLVQQCENISKRRVIRKAKAAAAALPPAASTSLRSTRSKPTMEGAAPMQAATRTTSNQSHQSCDNNASADAVSMEAESEKVSITASPPSNESVAMTDATVPASAALSAVSSSPSKSSSESTSSSPPILTLLPTPPKIDLSESAIEQLETIIVQTFCKSRSSSFTPSIRLDHIEMVGFEMMKIVNSYQMKPNRNDAISDIQQMIQSASIV